MKLRLVSFALSALLIAGASVPAAGKQPRDTAIPASAIRTLLLKEELRDTLALYNALVDRDDGAPTRKQWADRMFTEDATMQAFYPDGKPDIELHGRAAILQKFGGGENEESGLASKHYIVNVAFDELSDNHAKTHINALSVTTTKNIVDRHCPGCGNQPVGISMFVYDNDWVKVGGEWRMSRMVVHFKN